MRGRKPLPTAVKRSNGNPGKRGYNHAEPRPPEGLPDCPPHLSAVAQAEWDRIAETLYDMGVLTTVDRAALAAYCQAYGRWVEAEEKLKETPVMLKTPSGYVQQSPWLSVSNKQLELMGRYMAELGITPASRSRVASVQAGERELPTMIKIIFEGDDDPTRSIEGNAVVDRGAAIVVPENP
jgi:P27 family predicted phage terminase small subunit